MYIDGFNLYYGALKGTPFKWLDLRRFAEALAQNDRVQRVCYFTALLKTVGGDGGPRHRQGIYLDALKTIANVDVILGTFRRRAKRRPLLSPLPGLPEIVSVVEWEEKKTDVNLVTEMLFDAFNRRYEKAIVVSNDSDLARPIERIRDELGIRMELFNPFNDTRTPRELYRAASSVFRVRDYHLMHCLVPDVVVDKAGRQITKPRNW